MRGQLAVGATGLSAVLGHHLVDHVTWDIGGQDPDRDQILQLPFPQPVLIHTRHGSQPDRRMMCPPITRSNYATWHCHRPLDRPRTSRLEQLSYRLSA